MSNYEERFTEETKQFSTPLDNWNAAKQDTLSLLSQVRSILNSAAISAKNMEGTIYSQECDSINMDIVAPFAERIRNTRAPHYIVDATNAQFEREKNDRLRRAREQFRSRKNPPSSLGVGYETKAWGKLSSVAAALTENNSTTAQPASKMVRLQIHPSAQAKSMWDLDTGKCPCDKIFYSRDSIGHGCINCGKPLPPF